MGMRETLSVRMKRSTLGCIIRVEDAPLPDGAAMEWLAVCSSRMAVTETPPERVKEEEEALLLLLLFLLLLADDDAAERAGS